MDNGFLEYPGDLYHGHLPSDRIVHQPHIQTPHPNNYKSGLSVSFESTVALIFTQTCNLPGELYQLESNSPVTSRVHQAYSVSLSSSRCYRLRPLMTTLYVG